MNISAIICEFNPFHKGHRYLLDTVRQGGSDIIVCIMSGNFTQRGDTAIISKFTRAKQALNGGADIVIELPTVYACSSAAVFARAGVELADSLGCVDTLAFGCECGSDKLILDCAKAVSDKAVTDCTDRLLRSGEYYPKALQSSVREFYSDELADVLSNPNNTLAVEYCKALNNTKIKPMAIKRVKAQHNSDVAVDDFASASYIRKLLLGEHSVRDFLPDFNKEDYTNLHSTENLERAILYKLRTMTKSDFEKLPEVMQGLENRIYDSVKKYNSVNEIINSIKTKRYTHSRLRRIIIYALLGITKQMQNTPVPYIRVLGFNEMGAQVLSSAKKNDRLPIITKITRDYDSLSQTGKEIFDIDLKAADIFTISGNSVTACGEDYLTGTVIQK